jgi:hypothetical protein
MQLICPGFNAGGQLAVNDKEESVRDAELCLALGTSALAGDVRIARILPSKATSIAIILIAIDIRFFNALSLSSLFEINMMD